MKTVRDIRKSYRARFNRVQSAVRDLRAYRSIDPDEMEGTDIADMRALVEDITQSFHEFNAYWNCYHGDNERRTSIPAPCEPDPRTSETE